MQLKTVKLHENEAKNFYSFDKVGLLFSVIPVGDFIGAIIAGGAIRDWLDPDCNVIRGDVDFFFLQKKLDRLHNTLLLTHKDRVVFDCITGNARSYTLEPYGIKFQLIESPAESVYQLFQDFDFTISQFAMDISTTLNALRPVLYYSDQAIRDLRNKKLMVNHVRQQTLPGRIAKLVSYGFDLPASEAKALANIVDPVRIIGDQGKEEYVTKSY